MLLFPFKGLLLLALTYLPALAAQAQAPIGGRVVDAATGQPLPQTTVRMEGQASGTNSDAAGRFQLAQPTDPASARLIFSHLGYQSQNVPAQQLGPVIRLEELSYQIGEVLVTSESIRKLLLKKWKVDEGSITAVATHALDNLQKTDPAKAEKLRKKPNILRSVTKLARIVFLADGTVKVKLWLFGSDGKWHLDEVTRSLQLVSPKGENYGLTVVELTAGRLVLHDETNPARQNEVYVPVD